MSSKKDREKRKMLAARRRRDAKRSGEPKMSAVILELAEPLLKRYGDTPSLSHNIIALTIAAWNKAVLPADMQEGFDEKVLQALGPIDNSQDGREVIAYTMNLIAERRKQYYPHLRKYILSFDIDVSEGKTSLNVASASLPVGNT
jgi:hypothetical protein